MNSGLPAVTAAEARTPDPTEVVAIDGPSGAGKSTVARLVAERLGFHRQAKSPEDYGA